MPAGNVTVTAEFKDKIYTVTAATGLPNGSLSVDKSSAVMGEEVTVTVTPASNYRLKAGSLKYNGTGYSNVTIDGTTGKFDMVPANITITAEFELIPVLNVVFSGFEDETVNLALSSANALSRAAGDTLTITVSGFDTVLYWLQDGQIINNSAGTTSQQFNAAELSVGYHSVTVAVENEGKPYSKEVRFQVIDHVLLSITAASGISNGSLSFYPPAALEGVTITVTPEPTEGYRLKAGSLRYSGGGLSNQQINGPPPYTFPMPAENVTVSAEFEQIPVLNVVFSGFEDETVNLSLSSENDLSRAEGDTLTIEVGGSGTVQSWWLDGEMINNTGITSLQFNAAALSVGNHDVTVVVVVENEEKPYSNHVYFTVKE
jgi:hypothetical protein